MEEARCGAVFPDDASPVLMIRVDCSLFTLFTNTLMDKIDETIDEHGGWPIE